MAEVLRRNFSIDDGVGEYNASAVWGSPEDIEEVLADAGFGPLRAACAAGWDAAVHQMVYEDGTPVEIAENINPFRRTE